MTVSRKGDWADLFVGFMRWLHVTAIIAGIGWAMVWLIGALALVNQVPPQPKPDAQAYALRLLWLLVPLLIWFATRPFFPDAGEESPSSRHASFPRRNLPLHASYSSPDYIVLVAFRLVDNTRRATHEDLQFALLEMLPPTGDSLSGALSLEEYWVAMDERVDDSDRDSAIFVRHGEEGLAIQQLAAAGIHSE